jgi:hypothetical protein
MSPRLLRPVASGFTPKNLSGLVAWFDADDLSTFTLSGTAVSEWRDKSGNGYSVAQTDSNNRPARTGTIRGRACIDFDGTNDYLFSDGTGLAAIYSGDKSITVICVGEAHNAAEYTLNASGSWFSFGSTISATQFFYCRTNSNAGTLQIALRNDASNTSGGFTAAALGPAANAGAGNGDFFICSFASPSQGLGVIRAHNVMTNTGDSIPSPRNMQGSTTTGATARVAGNTTTDRFTVGALGRNTFSDFYPARMSEIIIYNRVIADTERAALVRSLGKKYNNEAVPVL